ncbi:MAG: DUF502 domain-containing protein [Deltaproteobacteria bacterium]|nr:DUF502 domain-containing protein [Deltaproteobacteria bacterium]
MSGLRRYFVTGLLVVVPLYITAYVLSLIVGFMDGVFNIIPEPLRPEAFIGFRIPGIGIVFTVIFVFIAGALTQNLLGRRLIEFGERLLSRVPFLRLIYNATKQLMETFLKKGEHGFRAVVLVEFPRSGVHSVGFVTSPLTGELKGKTAEGTLSVFIPTTPNPTTGFYILVKESEVKPLDMRIEDAFKVIMTGGIVMPNNDRQP